MNIDECAHPAASLKDRSDSAVCYDCGGELHVCDLVTKMVTLEAKAQRADNLIASLQAERTTQPSQTDPTMEKQITFTEGVRDMAFAAQDEVGDRTEFMPGEFEEMLERLREQLILRGPEG